MTNCLLSRGSQVRVLPRLPQLTENKGQHSAGQAVGVPENGTYAHISGSQTAVEESLFYIQNRGPVGNCALWWRAGGCGYTCDLDDAGVFTEEQAREICRRRPDMDRAWPKSQIDGLAVRHLDVQKLPIKRAGASA